MLTIHHLGVSQSDRIVWLCEELGIDYQVVRYERDPETNFAPQEYKALHPAGTAPVITDGNMTLGESAAIIDYLVARHGQGRLSVRDDQPDFATYLYWFHFPNGSLTPALMLIMGGGRMEMVGRNRLDSALAMIEARLSQSTWLAGETFTAAEIMIEFPLRMMEGFMKIDFAPFPAIQAYRGRIASRPAYQRAMAKAEPVQIFPA